MHIAHIYCRSTLASTSNIRLSQWSSEGSSHRLGKVTSELCIILIQIACISELTQLVVPAVVAGLLSVYIICDSIVVV